MHWFQRLLHRDRLERTLDSELRFHFDELVRARMAAGESPAAARRMARMEFGGLDQVKEECRDARGTRWVDDLWQDLRYSARTLRRSPAFTLVAVLSLALGIGANTAVFSLLDHLLLRLLPGVAEPRQLLSLQRVSDETSDRFSWPLFEKLRDTLPASAGLLAATPQSSSQLVVPGGGPEPARTQLVSGEFFPVLGVSPSVGRTLLPEDNRTIGAHPVAVLSHGFWMRRFSGDAGAVGRTITVNGCVLTVVGVAAPGFTGLAPGEPTDIWIPLMMQPQIRYAQNADMHDADLNKPWVSQEGISWLQVLLRQPDDKAQAASLSRLNAVLVSANGILAAAADSPQGKKDLLGERITASPAGRGLSQVRDDLATPLIVLMVTVGLVLLIACANIANLLLARASGRRREIAVRLSIGASRPRLIRQLLTESVMLAGLGGALGALFCVWGKTVLLQLTLGHSDTSAFAVPMDGRIFAFTALLCLATGLLFGIAPALRMTRGDLGNDLKSGSRTTGQNGGERGRGFPLGKALVVSQVAISMVLLVGAALFALTLRNLSQLDAGFERTHVLTALIDTRAAGYTPEQLPGAYQRLLDRVRGLPGVRSASLSIYSPLSGAARTSRFYLDGLGGAVGQTATVQQNVVATDYFSTYGITILRGREFQPQDTAKAPRVAVVNQALADAYFQGMSPLGRHFKMGSDADDPSYMIVGMIRNVRVNGLREKVPPMAWFPFSQRPDEYMHSLDIRTVRDPETVATQIRRVVAEVDPNLPIKRVRTLTEQVERSLANENLIATLTAAFGGLALLLACIGLYGVMSYTVSRRTSELGIRLALGATRSDLLWLVFRDTLRLTVAGTAIGLILSFAGLRLVAGLLYGLSPHDPLVLAGTAVILLLTALLAGYLPARRAARLDPLLALRCE